VLGQYDLFHRVTMLLFYK